MLLDEVASPAVSACDFGRPPWALQCLLTRPDQAVIVALNALTLRRRALGLTPRGYWRSIKEINLTHLPENRKVTLWLAISPPAS